MPNLNLLTSDEIPIVIDYEIMKCSTLIRSVIENLGFTDEVMPLMKVDYSTMQLILTWATHHKDDPLLPLDYVDMKMDINEIPEWDKKFLDRSHKEILDLIRAASYLHIPKLTEYCSKTVASFITGKTAAEICKTFGIEEQVDTERQVDNEEELDSNPLSDENSLSNKRKIETLNDSATELSALKRRVPEEQNEN